MNMASSTSCFLLLWLLGRAHGKWVEGRIDTKENWAFLARFCFLSLEGQFEYLIEYDKDMGMPNLLLYYDDDSQWPAVYHSSKTCKQREAVLNKAGQNQMIKLSYWYPDTEYSGCIIRRDDKEMPAEKSSTTSTQETPSTKKPQKKPKNGTKPQLPLDPAYYDQFLKTTTSGPISTIVDGNATTWYELYPTDDLNITTVLPDDDLWENVGGDRNGSQFSNLKDVEILFGDKNNSSHKIKRSTFELYERYRRRRLNSQPSQPAGNRNTVEKLVVSCHNSRRFRSARERWWFIAISNCDSSKGLDVRYKFLMTNGPDGDFWHEHFSADEFYVLPVLLAYTFAYVIVMIAVVMCSVELKSRHLLHSSYKLFLGSVVTQHAGVVLQSLATVRYAANGVESKVKVVGQFLCGVSETTFLLLLLLMAKGYTITRGRLKVGFTVKLTVFMCCYIVTYIVLFIYQAKAFDPGEVLYLYESPAGYGLIVLRVIASCVFAYATFFTVRKFPEKNMFYCPFFICGILWFYSGPLFILTANSYIDKWVRESVVTAVLLFITFSGHIMFLLLTLPVFANKNFPYHVRTTQIGVMEVTGNPTIDSFGPNAYHPTNGAAQTVIIPLTRRTEELIGNMYNQYMASAPPLSLENETPKLNGVPKRIDSMSPKNTLYHQSSSDTNTSDDIKPVFNNKDNQIFTVENQMSKLEAVLPQETPKTEKLPHENLPKSNLKLVNGYGENGQFCLSNVEGQNGWDSRGDLPVVLRSRRNILEPIKREEAPIPSWSLAKGPCVVAMQKKKSLEDEDATNSPNGSVQMINGRKVPPVRNGLQQSSGEISTIHEGHVQSYQNTVSKATIDLFSVANNKGS
ncbi:transmembrane protein 145-like [Plodia interpunctella]|uniref:transmembrane protein 145-like n=1 Tax=Plodia interpunctella TaxID=58824 RepID=UPI002367D580|nr:transmembrane protein 145-like [Plodia interpunctella]